LAPDALSPHQHSSSGGDNVGGVIVDGEPIHLTDYMEVEADQLCHSFVALAGLNLRDTVPPFSREMLRAVLDEWTESDKHHDKDRAYNMDYINIIAKARIAFRSFPTGSRSERSFCIMTKSTRSFRVCLSIPLSTRSACSLAISSPLARPEHPFQKISLPHEFFPNAVQLIF
jgi:hypothetical protein